MSGLLVPLGFPTTNAGGTEGLGVGVRTDNLTMVAPNGTSGTPAVISADIALVLKNGGQSVFALQGNLRAGK